MSTHDIKTKKTVKNIKSKNTKENLNHYIKNRNIHDKIESFKNQSDKESSNNQSNYSIDKIQSLQKQTAFETYKRTKNLIKNKKPENTKKKSNKTISKQDTYPVIKSKEQIKKESIIRNESYNLKKKKFKERNIKNKKSYNTVNNNKKEFNKINKSFSRFYKNKRSENSNDYKKSMKKFMLNKHKTKIKNDSMNISPMSHSNKLLNTIKKPLKLLHKSYNGLSRLWTYGTGLILVLVICLFVGVFGSLSNNNSLNTESSPLSAEVLAYEGIITQYAIQFGIEEYVPIIEAIMMQESGGLGNDPMQASECGFNTKYPHVPNGITDPLYSIEVGIQNFTDCLVVAKVADINDTNNLYLALQGYNYGKAYITWAIETFGCYSKANAKVYSDNKKIELKVKIYGDPEYVEHVLRYYHSDNIGLIEIARKEIGNKGGQKYWSWYGFNSKVNWCAIFVSWCANENGSINNTIPKFSLCTDGEKWYKSKNRWQNSSYIPKTGDIIFFDWQQDCHTDHVGIVEKVENSKIYTIEGNSKDEVKTKTYNLNNKSIYGFGLNY